MLFRIATIAPKLLPANLFESWRINLGRASIIVGNPALSDNSIFKIARRSHSYSSRSARSLPSFSGPPKQSAEDEDPVLTETDKEYVHAREFMRIPGVQQRILLVQPKLWRAKPGPRNDLTTLELQMEENKTLLGTLGWTVADSMVLNASSFDSTYIFGTGNFEKLEQAVRNAPNISGIFFGMNILKGKQLRVMRETFGIPIYDRYRVVLEIFRAHAKTREAKLQIALAELPYVRYCLLGIGDPSITAGLPVAPAGGGGGSGESWRQRQTNIIRVKI